MAQDPTPPLTPERLAALRAIPFDQVPSPGYVVHVGRLEENCQLLRSIMDETGAKILLALKGYACHATFPRIAEYLPGTTASGLHEALLARDFFGGEVHVYSPAFKQADLEVLREFAHTIVANSPSQLAFAAPILREAQNGAPHLGLRVNPELSTSDVDLYNPCGPCSRLGTTRAALDSALANLPAGWIDQIDGLHFHALCEQDSDALEATAKAFEEKFQPFLHGRRWLNFGGGHHITRPGYDIDRLKKTISYFSKTYNTQIYLEPGEAVALHTGVLVSTVVDLHNSGNERFAILDTSATCHMPDVLEMPYRPRILDAGEPGEKLHAYQLGGPSCLAGDVIGSYSFDQPLQIGQRLVFLDMAHYTMVKTSTFNGVPLPSINLFDPASEKIVTVREFGYDSYRDRLS